MTRMRLLKVIVQPIFVLDNGDALVEHQGETHALSPADAAGFYEKIVDEMAAYNTAVSAADAAPTPATEPEVSALMPVKE